MMHRVIQNAKKFGYHFWANLGKKIGNFLIGIHQLFDW